MKKKVKAVPARKKTRSGPSSKTAKTARHDLRQRKPKFHPFVESWGLRGRRHWEKQWEASRMESGRYLHPLIVECVGSLQWAFKLGEFPYSTRLHPQSPDYQTAKPNLPQRQSLRRKARSGVKLEQGELMVLKAERWMQQRDTAKWKRFGQLMLAAVASGDVAFFHHLICVLEEQSQPQREKRAPAIKTGAAVERAYAALRRDESIRQALQERPDMASSPAWSQLLYSMGRKRPTRPVPWHEIDRQMLENPEISKLVPHWKDNDVISRRREIQRQAKLLGIQVETKGLA